MSPVANQPSRIASAVASGRLRYSRNRLGPRTWISPIVSSSAPSSTSPSSSTSRTSTPGSGGPTVPGAGARVGVDGRVHERLGHPIALHHAAAGQLLDAGMLGGGQRRGPRHEQPRAAQRSGQLRRLGRRVGEAPVHRRHPEQHRPRPFERRLHALGREAADVERRPAAANRAEDPDHQAVHVKQRQPMGDDVGARSSPTPRRARRGWRRSSGGAGPRPWAARWCPRCRR